MQDFRIVNRALENAVLIKKEKIINAAIDVDNYSLIKLRDLLYRIGKIVLEDQENQLYIASIKGGWLKCNYATVAIQLTGECLLVAVYADEGLLYQHTSEGVIDELRKSIRT